MFMHDQNRGSTGLSAVPKLKPVHFKPNSFQRMNVKLAVQVRNDHYNVLACFNNFFFLNY
jgi:hypothetical protein